jgi:hypothetical protein
MVPGSHTRMSQSGAPDRRKALMIRSPYVVPRFVHLTSTQEKIALEMSHAACWGNPVFVKLLTPCNVAVKKTCQIVSNKAPTCFSGLFTNHCAKRRSAQIEFNCIMLSIVNYYIIIMMNSVA